MPENQINPEEILKVVQLLETGKAIADKYDASFAQGLSHGYYTAIQTIKAQFPQLFKK